MAETILVEGLTNAEFFERHAAPGRIGLVGGPELLNRVISRAQRHLNDERVWSRWSHAFLFQGRRHDGQHWVIESDLDVRHKLIRLGVQENPISKYHNDAKTMAVAVLDFGLAPTQLESVLGAALEQVALGVRYSLREIAGTIWALRHPNWRPRENMLARDRAFFCSALVRHVFSRAGIDLACGIAEKNTAPEHIASTGVPHTKWLMVRGEIPSSRPIVKRFKTRVKRVRARLKSKRDSRAGA